MAIRPPPYPSPSADPADEPRAPKSRRTAILLAVLFGPFGLLYVSPALAGLMIFAAIAAGMFTVGLALVPIWIACIVLAFASSPDEAEGSSTVSHEASERPLP